ncbi:hypothetical protein HDF19_03900 [Mucilaginibacter sp. E4BP6]|uniref:hypothetical protein n=1 Tax=Mucilaginibacter sp. E4BP6 TaxID=2723089 RepID=UPI0015C7E826|nr:hypothetical protein [Mucilaginibacter sp. E4BP6]NYE64612.1 hypothetical protein [Mucilaginibacter sp. E4BP6]
MPGPTELIDRIKSNFTREEFPAKTLLVKEGALAKKLLYVAKVTRKLPVKTYILLSAVRT